MGVMARLSPRWFALIRAISCVHCVEGERLELFFDEADHVVNCWLFIDSVLLSLWYSDISLVKIHFHRVYKSVNSMQ